MLVRELSGLHVMSRITCSFPLVIMVVYFLGAAGYLRPCQSITAIGGKLVFSPFETGDNPYSSVFLVCTGDMAVLED